MSKILDRDILAKQNKTMACVIKCTCYDCKRSIFGNGLACDVCYDCTGDKAKLECGCKVKMEE